MPRVPLDPRITVRAGQDFNEYQRQKAYLRSHTDCLVIPPKQHRKPRKGPNKSDPRITVTFKDDRKEYFRQKKYVEKHPDCVEIPPKKGTTVPSWLITVDGTEDPKGWQRQYQFLKKNPDAEYIPQEVIHGVKRRERQDMVVGRKDGKSGTGYDGAKHKDPRITVRSCDDRAEYRRQTSYLATHPDCVEIPPRQKILHRKKRNAK